MMSPDISPAALEQMAHREVPRMLTEWLDVPANQHVLIARPPGESYQVDFHLVIADLLFAVEVRKTTTVPGIRTALERVRKHADLQRELGHAEQCIIPLVVVPYMTRSAMEVCKEAEIPWLDLSGNAHIQSHCPKSNVFIEVQGNPNKFPKRGRPRNPFDGKAARITRHLLLNPGRSFAQVDLAKATDIDPGYTSRVVRRLLDLDLLIRENDEIRVREPEFLLRAWREENDFKHSIIRGHLPYQSPEDRVRRLAGLFEEAEITYAATGLAAAWAYTHAASFRTASIYVEPSYRDPLSLIEAIGFRRDTRAPNMRLLIPDDAGVFEGMERREQYWCVCLPQVFVDLEHEGERADELSEAVLSQTIERFSEARR